MLEIRNVDDFKLVNNIRDFLWNTCKSDKKWNYNKIFYIFNSLFNYLKVCYS